MLASLGQRLSESGAAFRDVFGNPNLRRLQLAWAGSLSGQYAFSITLAVYAYLHGGAAAVGVMAVIRTIPPAIVSPFASMLGDRLPRERIMLASDIVRAAAIGAAGIVAVSGGSRGVIFALAGVSAIAATVFYPAEAALLPRLARTPEELTAANVSSSTIESVGSFAGPALGGLLLAATSAGVVFIVTAFGFVWSALMIAQVRPDEPAEPEEPRERESMKREALAGFRAIALEPKLRLIVALYAAQTIVAGALGVLIVVTALDLLKLGQGGVGFLNSASGIGGLVGAIGAIALVGRKRLAGDFGIGIVMWGAPLLVIGLWPQPIVALLMLGVLGAGNTIVDVAALTLLQRTVADEVLTRVFGVLESLLVGTIGLGAIIAPLLIAGIGTRAALIVTGAFLPVLAALLWRRLTAIDAEGPARELALLRGVPIFALLPPQTLEHLAKNLVPVAVAAGAEVFHEGDHGDRFYIVGSGQVDVLVDGVVKPQGPGSSFGEIALLRDVPRTATVQAQTDVELYALERDEFIGAVTGHAPSRDAADAVIGERLGSLRTGIASV